jgi:hypothetical protein
MPKRKEVHKKKLIKSTEESEKQAEAEVKSQLQYISKGRVQKSNPSYHIGIQT